jgi:hypothetical protein
MHEAKTRLSQLVEHRFAALAGVWEGHVRIADDFDELPDDLADALGAR